MAPYGVALVPTSTQLKTHKPIVMNNNLLEFFVKMRDLMSNPLYKLASTTKKKMSEMKGDIDGVIKKNRELADSFRQTEDKVARSGGSMFGSLTRRFAGIAAVTAALSFAKGSVAQAMNFGATEKSFEVLTGSKDVGKGLARDLNDLQRNTILGPEVFKHAQTMMGFGMSTEKVLPTMRMLGDVSMGNKQKMEGLTLAYSQVTAAGRLMGQDLLQFINAGFNPLQVISEKTGISIGKLKEKMEKGAISAKMVEDAFKVATSAGGRFDGMMGKIGETAFGKAAVLEGQWESMKIATGEALMPMAEGLMSVASKTLEWLNVAKSTPEVLRSEQSEVGSLLQSIISLNEGNDFRRQLLQNLTNKYPDLFKGMDTEKAKNSELLDLLNNVNLAYEKRAGLASSDLVISSNNKEIAALQKIAEHNLTVYGHIQRGNWSQARKEMTWWEGLTTDKKWGNGERFLADGQEALSKIKELQSQNAIEGGIKRNLENQTLFEDAMKLANNQQQLMSMFPKESDRNAFRRELNSKMVDYNTFKSSKGLIDGFSLGNFENLRAMMGKRTNNAGDIKSGGENGVGSFSSLGNSSGDIARAITGSGPRVINIKMDNMVGKIEINSAAPQDAYKEVEKKVGEVFMRLLNSGSNLQN